MTDLFEALRAADPALGDIPMVPLADVLERYVTSPTSADRARWVGPTMAAAAAVMLIAGAATLAARRSTPERRVLSAASVLDPELLKAALAIAPPAQGAALADGVVTDDELGMAGQAMAECMAVRGSGRPSEWQELGTARVPSKLDDSDDECERDHVRWLAWAYSIQAYVRIWGDDKISIFMSADAIDEQVALVRSTVNRVAPASTVRFVDKPEALAEISALFPKTPEVVATTKLADVPVSFRLGGDLPEGLVEAVSTLPGVTLVRLRSDDLRRPPGNAIHLPSPYTSVSPVTSVAEMPTSAVLAKVQLVGRTFISTSILNGKDHPFDGSLALSISFNSSIVTATPTPTCNNPSGPYRLEGDRLIAGPFVSTAVGCVTGTTADEWAAGVLSSNPNFAMDGESLTLTAGDTVITFRLA
jgi:heat shock protein HslJ